MTDFPRPHDLGRDSDCPAAYRRRPAPNNLNLLDLADCEEPAKSRHTRVESDQTHQQQVSKAYKTWYEGVTTGKIGFYNTWAMAHKYLQLMGEPSTPDDRLRYRAVERWIKEQRERPNVEINLQQYLSSHTKPTAEDVGLMIGKALGFTEAEMWLYAYSCNPPFKSPGAAFFTTLGGKQGQAIDQLLDCAKLDWGGRVLVPEMVPGAIESKKRWLAEEHKNHSPYTKIEELPRPFWMGVFAHIYNPIANGVGAAMGSIGDIIQGLGLPLHLLTNRTFFDNFADFLRTTGQELPMNALYTQDEMNDAMVMLVNIYASGLGGVAPYMATGGLSKIAGMTPKAAALTAELIGMAGNSGQVYDTAMSMQARAYAIKEAQDNGRQLDEEALRYRIQDIKEGKNISQADRDHMDRYAVLAAALAAPVGYAQGKMLPELGRSIAAGQSIDSISKGAFSELKASLKLGDIAGSAKNLTIIGGALTKHVTRGFFTGSLLSMYQLSANEMALTVAGVETPDQAAQHIEERAPQAAFQGGMIFGTGQVFKLRYSSSPAEVAAHQTYQARFNELHQDLTPTIETITTEQRTFDKAKAGAADVEYADFSDFQSRGIEKVTEDCRIYKFKGYDFEIVVPESYAKQLDRVRELRGTAGLSIFEHPDKVREIETARLELSNNPLKDRLLPEQLAHLLKEVPNPQRLKSVEMLDFRHPDGVYNEQKKQKWANAAADASDDGRVRVFDKSGDNQPFIHEAVFHEWAHLAQFMGESYKSFAPAAACESDYFHREYATKNDAENWAVHFGEVLLNPDATLFQDFCDRAPIRTMIAGMSLQEELAKVPEGQRSPHHSQFLKRAEYIEKKIVPKAREYINELLTSNDPKKTQNALDLINSIRDDAHRPDVAARLIDESVIKQLASSDNVETKAKLAAFLDKAPPEMFKGINPVQLKRQIGLDLERALKSADPLIQEKTLEAIQASGLYKEAIVSKEAILNVFENGHTLEASMRALKILEFGGRFEASPELIDVLTRVGRKNLTNNLGADCIEGLRWLNDVRARLNMFDLVKESGTLGEYELRLSLDGLSDTGDMLRVFEKGLELYRDGDLRTRAIERAFDARRDVKYKIAMLDALRNSHDPSYKQVLEYILAKGAPELQLYARSLSSPS